MNAGAGCAAPDDAPSAVSDPDADADADDDDDDDDDDDAAARDADSDDTSAEAFGVALASPLCEASAVRGRESRCVQNKRRNIDISAFSFNSTSNIGDTETAFSTKRINSFRFVGCKKD